LGCWFNHACNGVWLFSTSFGANAMKKIDAVYIHLKRHKHITSWEAINLYRATRLADIVYKLKNQGFNIETVMVQNENTRFARYFLKDRK
jgi:hypothetical protein